MIYVFRVAAFIALIAAAFWVYSEPKFDSWVACAAAFAALIGAFLVSPNSSAAQIQNVGSGSTGIQAGGNVKAKISNRHKS